MISIYPLRNFSHSFTGDSQSQCIRGTVPLIYNARKKLQKKNLDFIVLNSLRNPGTCFQSDDNQISIISTNGQTDYERKPKNEVAHDIIDYLSTLFA